MTDDYSALQIEVHHLAQQLFGNGIKRCASFTNRLLDICSSSRQAYSSSTNLPAHLICHASLLCVSGFTASYGKLDNGKYYLVGG